MIAERKPEHQLNEGDIRAISWRCVREALRRGFGWIERDELWSMAGLAIAKVITYFDPSRSATSRIFPYVYHWAPSHMMQAVLVWVNSYNRTKAIPFSVLERFCAEAWRIEYGHVNPLDRFLCMGIHVDPGEYTEVPPWWLELTPREREIVLLRAKGHTWREIGEYFGESKQNVHQTHKKIRARVDELRAAIKAQ